MFGSRRDNSGDQRVLVAAAEPVNEDGGDAGDLNLNEGTHMSYHDVLLFVRRRKCMFAFAGTGLLLLLAIIIGTICATAGSGPVIPPSTPAPLTSTTPSTTTTTEKPTTTSATTTTTTSTTTTPTTTTTTSTTTKPTTTTTTSTTTAPTTTASTTTTEHPPPPGPPIPTAHPLPSNTSLPASVLLNQVFNPTQLNYTEIHCVIHDKTHPTFKYILTIEGVSAEYPGESSKLAHAREVAARAAAVALFGISYKDAPIMPGPPHPCNGKSLPHIPSEDWPAVTDN